MFTKIEVQLSWNILYPENEWQNLLNVDPDQARYPILS
jgi:hypothetical protein